MDDRDTNFDEPFDNDRTAASDGMPAAGMDPPGSANDAIPAYEPTRAVAAEAAAPAPKSEPVAPSAPAQEVLEPEPPACEIVVTIPAHIISLCRLGPEFLPADGGLLLQHIQLVADELAPVSTQDWFDCVQIGRYRHNVSNYHALAEVLRKLKRRPATRELLKPGWMVQGRPPALPQGADRAEDMRREMNNRAGTTNLELQRYDYDPIIEEELKELLDEAGLTHFVIEAEAFRMNLPELMRITELIASEEARCDSRIDRYHARHAIAGSSRLVQKAKPLAGSPGSKNGE